ncbi:hypothetical protein [Vibrio alginolyticus]|uniref:hypothetical protein n=1 Tax=Vibrio alginolyticus TaxID=663 RepID=UPI0015F4D7F2|nr:hypothetical protein [Vibrio alginolyticus]
MYFNFNRAVSLIVLGIVFVSTNAHADDSGRYQVKLSANVTSSLGFSFLDELLNPVPSTQNVILERPPKGRTLTASSMFHDTTIASNDPNQTFSLKRTLSPFAFNGDESAYGAIMNILEVNKDDACEEVVDGDWFIMTNSNESLQIETSSIKAGERLCDTDVILMWDSGESMQAGTYSGRLILNISPNI